MADRTEYWRFTKFQGLVTALAVGRVCPSTRMVLPPTDGGTSFTGTYVEALAEAKRIQGLLDAEDRSVTTPWGATIKVNTKAA